MIKFSFQLLILVFLWSCNTTTTPTEQAENSTVEATKQQQPAVSEDGTYGAKISGENPIDGPTLVNMLNEKDSVWVTLKSTIVASCQHSGCWMDLDLGDDHLVKVSFKDYAFFIPFDSKGKTATVEGYALRELILVDMLKHYAEDDNKTREEIDAITEPELAYTFEAIGVIIKD